MSLSDVEFDRRKVGGLTKLKRYHEHILSRKSDIIARRKALGDAYLKAHADRDPGAILTKDTGVVSLPLSNHPLAIATVKEARSMVEDHAGRLLRTKGSLDYLTGGKDYSDNSAAVQLAWSPELLSPTIRYFGMMPMLYDIFFTRANAKEVLTTTSHMYHVDPDDITQVKAFVHLTDVDAGCGPFHALPAHLSEKVVQSLNYDHGRIMDDQVETVVGNKSAVPSIGPAGTVTLCDTTRCLHFGGRPPEPGKPVRDILVIRYHVPTCTLYPQFPGDGDTPRKLDLHERPGDDAWNAFIGAELVC